MAERTMGYDVDGVEHEIRYTVEVHPPEPEAGFPTGGITVDFPDGLPDGAVEAEVLEAAYEDWHEHAYAEMDPDAAYDDVDGDM